MPFQIEFSPDGLAQLQSLRKFDQTILLSQIEAQLRHDPPTPSRRRKPMRSNLIATRELRVDSFRVCYDVDAPRQVALVRAIGMKRRNRVFIAGEEVDLL